MRGTTIEATRERTDASLAVFAGFSAILLGIGLARFGYTPLIPALVVAHWLTPAEAAYLGAANLVGYLAGALLAARLSRRFPAPRVLLASMLLVAVSCLACALPLSFAWFLPWRFLSGFGGGIVMILAAPTVLHALPARLHGLASGLMFTGVGGGIIASATFEPVLLRSGPTATWLAMGAAGIALTVLAARGWPAHNAVTTMHSSESSRRPHPVGVRTLSLQYGLNAIGLVPHMVFLVDFVARGRHAGLGAGAQTWLLFGLGALTGPVILGWIASRLGVARSMRLGYVVQLAAVAALLGDPSDLTLAISSLVMGAFAPGISALCLQRVRELTDAAPEHHAASWGVATASFSVGQAVAAYGLSYVFATTGAYHLLFAVAAAALALALVIDLVRPAPLAAA